jgi:hypothetical protein
MSSIRDFRALDYIVFIGCLLYYVVANKCRSQVQRSKWRIRYPVFLDGYIFFQTFNKLFFIKRLFANKKKAFISNEISAELVRNKILLYW